MDYGVDGVKWQNISKKKIILKIIVTFQSSQVPVKIRAKLEMIYSIQYIQYPILHSVFVHFFSEFLAIVLGHVLPLDESL